MIKGRHLALVLLAALCAPPLAAQSDYYNTDRNRPIRIEDAYAAERYSFDAHLAPIRLERGRGGVYEWGIDPEIAYGILPRTQLEVGIPIVFTDGAGGRGSGGLAGIDASLLYTLNTETQSLPAFGVRASVLAPIGSRAPERGYPSLQGMMTRTSRWGRLHVNVAYTFGPDAAAGDGGAELSRWVGGAAVDRAFPLLSLLVTGELYAQQPIGSEDAIEWNAGTGIRYQLTPYLALDGGFGRRLTGSDQAWYFTFGFARVFALPGLFFGR